MSRSIALGLAFLVACGASDRVRGNEGDSGRIQLRMTAMDGGEIDLARYRGRVVVVHLFDTDSNAAALDADQLVRLDRDRHDRVVVIGVCFDREGYPMAAAWRRALGVRYLIALADPHVREGRSPLGRVRVVPTTYLVDESGRLAQRIERPLQPGEIDRMVTNLIR